MYSYHIWRAWKNGSYTMMAKPIRAVELRYPMIQFLIKFVIPALELYSGINGANKAIRVNVYATICCF